jgi:hypothetical protein
MAAPVIPPAMRKLRRLLMDGIADDFLLKAPYRPGGCLYIRADGFENPARWQS